MDIKQILQNNGLEEGLATQVAQAINSELPKHFVKKEQYNKKVNIIDSLQEQLNDYEAKKEEPNKFEELYNSAKQEIEQYKTKELNSNKLAKIKEELKKANYTDEKILNSISKTFDLNSIELTDEGIKGLDISEVDNIFGSFKTTITEGSHKSANPPQNTHTDAKIEINSLADAIKAMQK